MEYAKPWETTKKQQATTADHIARAAQPPWEPDLPRVAPEILQAAKDRDAADGLTWSIDAVKAQAFAKSYLIDFEPTTALLRAGLADETMADRTVANKARAFMRNPLVLQALQDYMERVDEKTIVSRNRVMMGLLEEANYRGLGGSASARVAAWAKLAKLIGMELPDKDPRQQQEEEAARGGVMRIPMVTDIEAWEAAAMGAQRQLKADVRS